MTDWTETLKRRRAEAAGPAVTAPANVVNHPLEERDADDEAEAPAKAAAAKAPAKKATTTRRR
ncbi:MAG: hypothetical protein ACRDZ3_20825 [Acidimicrobiia bacterium]